MAKMLLVAAVGFAAFAAPAGAQSVTQFSPEIGTRSSHWGASPSPSSNWRQDGDRDRDGDRGHGRHDRHHRGHDGDVVAPGGWYGGDWAYYNNRSFEPDSYNDWWHDRPDRAFPRWMRNNQNCERLWWSGGGWRC